MKIKQKHHQALRAFINVELEDYSELREDKYLKQTLLKDVVAHIEDNIIKKDIEILVIETLTNIGLVLNSLRLYINDRLPSKTMTIFIMPTLARRGVKDSIRIEVVGN